MTSGSLRKPCDIANRMILANGDLSGTQGRFSAAKLSWASGRPRLPSLPRNPHRPRLQLRGGMGERRDSELFHWVTGEPERGLKALTGAAKAS
ncbi:hypothetical protein ATOBIA_N02890 [Atopobiaceae bacterium P1]|uniref:Uncharacterized protein n=1 Tax=Leptogranulimonas caecicola TaxID=2894156 RepID=A0AAU9CIZ8_9ACTN|nr:hypothetical protein ATOBIA_N02890 [Atopobiaceae bacterium P1]BDC90408.1 hypothetical protein ATTO_02800 [Leptogranulimonas caecicola]